MVAGLECFDTTLMPHLIVLGLGIFALTPAGDLIMLPALKSKYPVLDTKFGRTIAGLLLIMFSGFTVSAHTLWMHNKAQEMGGGSFCSGGGVCDCASVIGNADWNTAPVIGVPWGLLGMLAFALFMWIVISIAKEPSASWVLTNLKIGTNFAILGMGIVFYLMYAEYEIGKICQFCTTAHAAHVATTVGLFKLAGMHSTDDWVKGKALVKDEGRNRQRRKKSGYVVPKAVQSDSGEEEE